MVFGRDPFSRAKNYLMLHEIHLIIETTSDAKHYRKNFETHKNA